MRKCNTNDISSVVSHAFKRARLGFLFGFTWPYPENDKFHVMVNTVNVYCEWTLECMPPKYAWWFFRMNLKRALRKTSTILHLGESSINPTGKDKALCQFTILLDANVVEDSKKD